MGFFSKISRRNDLKDFEKVRHRLVQLVRSGVISEIDLSGEKIPYGNDTVPRVISTIDRLYNQGYLSGVKDSIERFCHLVGIGEGIDNLSKGM